MRLSIHENFLHDKTRPLKVPPFQTEGFHRRLESSSPCLVRISLRTCIFFIPLFECLCCEDVTISSTCCNNQNADDDTCDVHPCLDAIDELGIVEVLDYSNFLALSKWSASHFGPIQDSTKIIESFCPPTFSFKTKRHLVIGVIIV